MILKLFFKNSPIENLKTIKNKTEIAGAIKAHEADGIALRKFFNWIKTPKNLMK